jgi:uncharacterized protein YggE
MRRQLILLVAAAMAAIAQTDTNTITITASRNVSVAPDQVVYTVSATTDSSAGLTDAVALVAEAGITTADLSYTSGYGTTVIWEFQHAVPFSSMKDTSLTLAKLVRQSAIPNGVPSISYSVASVHTSQAAQSQACQLSALVSDARREAERLAAAVGVHVGAIVGLSDQPETVGIPTVISGIFDANLSVTWVGIPNSFLRVGTFISPPQQTSCSMVVQFRLLP